jgi:hypothetical protein
MSAVVMTSDRHVGMVFLLFHIRPWRRSSATTPTLKKLQPNQTTHLLHTTPLAASRQVQFAASDRAVQPAQRVTDS